MRPSHAQPVLRRRFLSDPAELKATRKAVEQFARDAGFDIDAACDCGLCVNEAIANIIRHAYTGRTDRPLELTAEVDGDQLRIRLRDWGSGIDPSSLPAKPYDPHEPGGVGLVCLKTLMDEVVYTPLSDGMLLTMTRRRSGPMRKTAR